MYSHCARLRSGPPRKVWESESGQTGLGYSMGVKFPLGWLATARILWALYEESVTTGEGEGLVDRPAQSRDVTQRGVYKGWQSPDASSSPEPP